jgi:hypothetical protein
VGPQWVFSDWQHRRSEIGKLTANHQLLEGPYAWIIALWSVAWSAAMRSFATFFPYDRPVR